MGIPPATNNGDVAPSVTTICGFNVVQAVGLEHKYNYEPCKDVKKNQTQPMNDLGDLKDEHGFCDESE